MTSSYVYDPLLIEEQKSVVKIEIDGVDWYMEFDEWEKSQSEGRTKCVILHEKLIMVSPEDYELLVEVMETLEKVVKGK
jgi:hypothetical protein